MTENLQKTQLSINFASLNSPWALCLRGRATEVARMVESVDTRDLKSLGYCSCAGSSPAPGTINAW